MRALYVGRDDRKKTGFWWHAMCDAAKHKNAARPESACRGSTVPAHRLVGAAGAVSAVVFGQAGVAKNTTCGKLALDPPTRLFGNFFVEIREEVPVAVAVRWQRDR